jgi:predicted transcriptional regulator
MSEMSTTTIRIDDELKQRIATAAERSGKTAHAFILDAIEQTVEQAELDNAFHQIADERWAELLQTGKSVGWDDAERYLQARAQGKPAGKPAARKVKR